MRKYTCEDNIASVTVLAPDKSCLFCKHCTDVYWDYTNGPYLLCCDKNLDIKAGSKGKCKDFEEE